MPFKTKKCSCILVGIKAVLEFSSFVSCDISLDEELGSGTYFISTFFNQLSYFLALHSYKTVYKGMWNFSTVAIKKYNVFLPSNDIEAQNFFNFRNDYIAGFRRIRRPLNALILEYCKFGSVQSWFKKESRQKIKIAYLLRLCTRNASISLKIAIAFYF